MPNDVKAAQALLAYFNRPLMLRLVKHVLKESSARARAKLADAVIEQAVKQLNTTTWNAVVKFVEDATTRYVQSEKFKVRVEKLLEHNADYWAGTAMKDIATNIARKHLESYAMREFMKTIPGRFQAIVEQEIATLAKLSAQKETQS